MQPDASQTIDIADPGYRDRALSTLLRLVGLAQQPVSRLQLTQLFEDFLENNAPPEGAWPDLAVALDLLLADGRLVVQNGRHTAPPGIVDPLLREGISSGDSQRCAETVARVFKIGDYRYGYFVKQYPEGVRDLRLALYAQRYDDFARLAQTLQSYFSAEWRSRNPYVTLLDNPFSPEQFDRLPSEIALPAAATLLAVHVSRLESCSGPLTWLRDKARHAREEQRGWFSAVLCEPLVIRGHLDEAVVLSHSRSPDQPTPVAALVCVLRGRMDEGLRIFEAVLKENRKGDLRKSGMAGLCGIAYVVTLIVSGDPRMLEKASAHIAGVMKSGSPMVSVYACLGHVARATQAVDSLAVDERVDTSEKDLFGQLFRALACWWVDGAGDRIDRERLSDLYHRAESQGFRWVAAEALELLGRMDTPQALERAERIHYELGTRTLVDAIRRQPLWERALGALERLGGEYTTAQPSPKTTRLVWWVSLPGDTGRYLIEAREQKRLPDSLQWSAGKGVSVSRLLTTAQEPDSLTDQDRTVIHAIRQSAQDYKANDKKIDCQTVLALLAHHPSVYWAHDGSRPLQIETGRADLEVLRERHQLRLRLNPDFPEEDRFWVVREASYRLRVYELSPEQDRARRIIGTDGLSVPLAAEPRFKQTLASLSLRFVLRSAIGGSNLETTPSNSQLYALLSPVPSGLALELVVYPQGEGGDYWTPGAGHPLILTDTPEGGSRNHAWLRHLSTEVAQAEKVFSACRRWLDAGDTPFKGQSLHPAAACEVLQILRDFGDAIQLRWPQGESLKIRGGADVDQLRVSIASQGDWLNVSGHVEVDSNTVIELRSLLQAAATPNTRFVALKDGQYLALSERLLKKARELGGLTEPGQFDIVVHTLAAGHLSEVIAGTEQSAGDSGWRQLISRHDELSQWHPAVPETLQAELRDYQRAGYEWLARHAQAGAGACLADDMGLGKTVQTLALLLYRASLGPTLVVAPTSVCSNWESEASRFAPSLRVRWFSNGQRDKEPLGLGPGDLLIMSYTLFQQENELISGQEWATLVLDEAQAIKNAGTKRSQAAMRLKAGFRMLTTGTPIENHLGELWNLFRFINPGLLGSLDSFTERFALPIEKNADPEARERLRRLIQPFILRRTKSQVLTELPQRTEVVLHLEQSAEERAVYEAVRLEALHSVTQFGDEPPNRIRVLAGIMKLRRACCHGSLVLDKDDLVSCKISALMEIVDELHESGHRALIFSQFVDYLTLIRTALDDRDISYQYLDGSTPSSERSKRVKSFQEGSDDFFLISLKAGGVGLNLTAADYVIHMDPWWNPAVEDQASDRAHRIGQTRPVTVYRLIARDTIEDKIVALHERKRHLADSLLDGAGETSVLSTEELIGLLKDQ